MGILSMRMRVKLEELLPSAVSCLRGVSVREHCHFTNELMKATHSG